MGDPASIAAAFLDAYARPYAAGDAAGLSMLYGDDSAVSFDGGTVNGRAGIAAAIAPRVAGGPVGIKWATKDAQATATGHLIVFATGESSRPAGKFTEVFTLFAIPAGGMYVRNDITRFGAGAAAMNAGADASGMAAQFAQQYYAIYSSSRASLSGLYRDTSQHTFEGGTAVGPAAIAAQIARMPPGTLQLETLDAHPVAAGTVLLLVTGKITLEGERNALPFAQAFQLVNAGGAPYVSNEFFRLSLL